MKAVKKINLNAVKIWKYRIKNKTHLDQATVRRKNYQSTSIPVSVRYNFYNLRSTNDQKLIVTRQCLEGIKRKSLEKYEKWCQTVNVLGRIARTVSILYEGFSRTVD